LLVPLPSEFGADLVPPEEFDAENALEPEIVAPVQVVDPSVPVVSEIEPEAPDIDGEDDGDDDEYWEALPEQTLASAVLALNRPPLFAVSETFTLATLRLAVNDPLVLRPDVDVPALSTIDSFIKNAPSLNSLATFEGSDLVNSIGGFVRTGAGSLSLTAPTGASVQLGTKIIEGGVTTAVAIGDQSAVLFDALRLRADMSVLASSAEGSTLPVGEEIPVVPAPPIKEDPEAEARVDEAMQ
jgi:hypothetical protein